MVLQFSTSPFAGRAPPSALASSSISNPISSSHLSTTSPSSPSTSSSVARFPLLADMASGRRQDLSLRSQAQHRHHRRCTSGATSSVATTVTLIASARQQQKSLVDLWARTIFRLLGVVSGVSTILIVPTLRTTAISNGFGRGSQFLTIVSLVLTMICLSLGIAGDLLKRPVLIRLKNALLPIVAPADCAVAVLYWSLTLTNAYYIYPDGNRYIPLWLDLQMHGLPLIYILTEMFCFSKTFQVHRVNNFCAIAVFSVMYMFWSSFCAYMDGYWPYPILDNAVSLSVRLRLMLTSSAVGIITHFVISETYIRTKTVQKLQSALEHAGTSL